MEQYGNPEIINSDQADQFTSNDYIEFLKAKNIRQSMDGKARWVDNVVIERWFHDLKTELIYINEYSNPREPRQQIGGYIKDYNNERPHQALGYKLPVQVYQTKSVCNLCINFAYVFGWLYKVFAVTIISFICVLTRGTL